jgi:hypothetical protein
MPDFFSCEQPVGCDPAPENRQEITREVRLIQDKRYQPLQHC